MTKVTIRMEQSDSMKYPQISYKGKHQLVVAALPQLNMAIFYGELLRLDFRQKTAEACFRKAQRLLLPIKELQLPVQKLGAVIGKKKIDYRPLLIELAEAIASMEAEPGEVECDAGLLKEVKDSSAA